MGREGFRKTRNFIRLNNSKRINNDKHHVALKVRVKLSDFLCKMAPDPEFDVQLLAGATVADIISVLTERL